MTDEQRQPDTDQDRPLIQNGSGRRRALLGISSALGGVGSVAAAAPFLSGLRPSRKTQAAGAPVSVPLDGIARGELRVAIWRQKPVWILHRNAAMIAELETASPDLLDPDSDSSAQPDYCKNKTRSLRPEYFVAVGLCTHLGCSPGWEGGGRAGIFVRLPRLAL